MRARLCVHTSISEDVYRVHIDSWYTVLEIGDGRGVSEVLLKKKKNQKNYIPVFLLYIFSSGTLIRHYNNTIKPVPYDSFAHSASVLAIFTRDHRRMFLCILSSPMLLFGIICFRGWSKIKFPISTSHSLCTRRQEKITNSASENNQLILWSLHTSHTTGKV